MICDVPAELAKIKQKAEARRGYQIRKAQELGILPICQEILQCGNAASAHLSVYHSKAGGIGVSWYGSTVYHNLYGTVTLCHLDYVWVDALHLMLAQAKRERKQTQAKTARLQGEIAHLSTNFG